MLLEWQYRKINIIMMLQEAMAALSATEAAPICVWLVRTAMCVPVLRTPTQCHASQVRPHPDLL